MASSTISLLLSFIILLLLHRSHGRAAAETTSIYEILPVYGLPSGIFPDSVKNYTFIPKNGNFVVQLNKQPCYVQFDDYLFSYDELITGTLKLGSITKLKGIRVKWLMLWLQIEEIKVDLPPNDNIYLQFGFVNRRFDVHQFQTVHSCSDENHMWMFKQQQLQSQVGELPVYATK